MSLTISILFSGLFVFKEIYICPSAVTSRKPKHQKPIRLIESAFQHLFDAELGRISLCTICPYILFLQTPLSFMQLQPLHGLPSEDQAGASSRHASCSTGGCCRSDDMIDVIIFLDDIIDAHCDCQQAEAEKAKAAAPAPGVNL